MFGFGVLGPMFREVLGLSGSRGFWSEAGPLSLSEVARADHL